jgi:membrane protease YdiL (CAAX protease family)
MDPRELAANPWFWALAVYLLVVMGAMIGVWAWVIRRWCDGQAPLLPAARRHRVPWGAGPVLTILLTVVALSLGASAVITRGVTPSQPVPLMRGLVAQGLVNLLIILAVPAMLRISVRASWRDIGLTRAFFWRNVARGALGAFLLAPLCFGIMALCRALWPGPSTEHPLVTMLGGGLSAPVVAIALGSAVLIAPIAEELLFRGVLLGWFDRLFARGPRGQGPAQLPTPLDLPAIACASLFAALHASQWPAPIPLFVLALGLGHLARATRGLVAPIAMHATFNAISTFGAILAIAAGQAVQ